MHFFKSFFVTYIYLNHYSPMGRFMFSQSFKISILSATVATLLTACGGGSENSAPTANKIVTGVAVDFYLKDANVTFSNKACSNTKTDDKGKFTFRTTSKCQESDIIITGGTDIGTGLPFTGMLKLKTTDFDGINHVVVSPLTTLEKYLIDTDQTNQFDAILKNLNIEVDSSKVSTFDPVADGNAQTAATAFALQQLINKIEDNLENLQANGQSVFTAEQSNQIALAAIVNVLKTQPLFEENTLKINETTLDEVLDTAFTEAENELQQQDPELLIPNSIIDTIATDTKLLGSVLNNLVAEGTSGEDLINKITDDEVQQELESIIQTPPTEVILQPHYANFNFAGYSLDEVIQSTSSQPILLAQADLEQSFKIDFGISNTKTALTDTFKLGFKINTKNSQNNTEQLDLILDEVVVNFDATGKVKSARIAQGTLVTVNSSVEFPVPGMNGSMKYAQIEAPRDFSLTNNGNSLSLAQLLNSDSRLQSAYNTYKGQLTTGSRLTSQVFLKPSKYTIDPALGLQLNTMTIKNYSFSAPSMTAHFQMK